MEEYLNTLTTEEIELEWDLNFEAFKIKCDDDEDWAKSFEGPHEKAINDGWLDHSEIANIPTFANKEDLEKCINGELSDKDEQIELVWNSAGGKELEGAYQIQIDGEDIER